MNTFYGGVSALNVVYRYYPSDAFAVVNSFDPWIIPDLQEKGYNVLCVDSEITFPGKPGEVNDQSDHIPSEALKSIARIDIIQCNGTIRIISTKKVVIGDTEYTFPEKTFTLPEKVKVKGKEKEKAVSNVSNVSERIRILFGSGEFTCNGAYVTNLYIRPFKDYITEYRRHYKVSNVAEFRETLVEVLLSCNHDILANKNGDYKCRKPSLHFGLYTSN